MTTPTDISRLRRALPFWLSLVLPLIAWIGAVVGGWTVLLLPLSTWYLFSIIDAVLGETTENADPATAEADLFWYKLVTQIWIPIQFLTLFGIIAYVTARGHLSGLELVGLFFGLGVISGTVGVVYAHELLHQRNRLERWLGDILLAMVLYSHFRSEHLLVHHRYVGTNRDPVTARYNEGFHRFLPRVIFGSAKSSFKAERAMLARRNRPWHDRANPFWRYWALQGLMVALALMVGGMAGAGPVRHPGGHGGLAAGAGQLRRTLRADPQTPG